MMDELSDPAKRQKARLDEYFRYIYDSFRYVVAILFSDLISGIFGILTLSDTMDLQYKAVGLGIFGLCAFVLDVVLRTYPIWTLQKMRAFAGYLMQMFFGGILGNLQSLAYDVGTVEYVYMSIGMLFGILIIGSVIAIAYMHVGESRIIAVENDFNYRRQRFKHPSFVKKQIKASSVGII